MSLKPISYSLRGACTATGYSRSYLYIAIREGRLKTFKRGNRTFTLHEALEKLVRDDANS